MNSIVIDFSGWVKIDAKSARFVSVLNPETVIDGEKWLALNEGGREMWVLECAIQSLRDCDDGEWTQLDVFPEGE
jgi:hypothetical protein